MSSSEETSSGPSASKVVVEDWAEHDNKRKREDREESDTDLNEYESLSNRRSVERSPPPQYPALETSSPPRSPPAFSSLYSLRPEVVVDQQSVPKPTVGAEGVGSTAAPAYTTSLDSDSFNLIEEATTSARAFQDPIAETKHALPRDTKGEPSCRKEDDAEPPPAYSEEDNPLPSFAFLMAAAGGAASIITQVQQGGPPINTIGDVGADETIAMDLR